MPENRSRPFFVYTGAFHAPQWELWDTRVRQRRLWCEIGLSMHFNHETGGQATSSRLSSSMKSFIWSPKSWCILPRPPLASKGAYSRFSGSRRREVMMWSRMRVSQACCSSVNLVKVPECRAMIQVWKFLRTVSAKGVSFPSRPVARRMRAMRAASSLSGRALDGSSSRRA